MEGFYDDAGASAQDDEPATVDAAEDNEPGGWRAPMDLESINERFKEFKKEHGMKRPHEVRLRELAHMCYVLGIVPRIRLESIEDTVAAEEENHAD